MIHTSSKLIIATIILGAVSTLAAPIDQSEFYDLVERHYPHHEAPTSLRVTARDYVDELKAREWDDQLAAREWEDQLTAREMEERNFFRATRHGYKLVGFRRADDDEMFAREDILNELD